MKNTSLKNKLKNNELSLGSWITIGHPSIPEILAQAGFEWLVIDIEHNLIDPLMLHTLIATIQSKDIAALVRVSDNDKVIIKQVLDAGADGVIVPMVCTKEDAEMAVNYSYYPPRGERGVGLSRAQGYGESFEDYIKWQSNSLTIIAQIEHIEGVNNIDDIISTDGIDGIIIGPYDLSGSLGCTGDLNNPKVTVAIKNVENTCLKNNFPLGFHVVEPNISFMQEKIYSGYKFLAYSTDFYFLQKGIDINIIKRG